MDGPFRQARRCFKSTGERVAPLPFLRGFDRGKNGRGSPGNLTLACINRKSEETLVSPHLRRDADADELRVCLHYIDEFIFIQLLISLL